MEEFRVSLRQYSNKLSRKQWITRILLFNVMPALMIAYDLQDGEVGVGTLGACNLLVCDLILYLSSAEPIESAKEFWLNDEGVGWEESVGHQYFRQWHFVECVSIWGPRSKEAWFFPACPALILKNGMIVEIPFKFGTSSSTFVAEDLKREFEKRGIPMDLPKKKRWWFLPAS